MCEVQCQKCDDFDQNFPDEDKNNNRSRTARYSAGVRQYLLNKLLAIKTHNYQVNNVKLFAKFLRRKLNLNKAPKKKGYGRYFTDEEQR